MTESGTAGQSGAFVQIEITPETMGATSSSSYGTTDFIIIARIIWNGRRCKALTLSSWKQWIISIMAKHLKMDSLHIIMDNLGQLQHKMASGILGQSLLMLLMTQTLWMNYTVPALS